MGSSAVESGWRERQGVPYGGSKSRANYASNNAEPLAGHSKPVRSHRNAPQPQMNQKSPSHGRAKESPRYINQTSRVRETRRPWGRARAQIGRASCRETETGGACAGQYKSRAREL